MHRQAIPSRPRRVRAQFPGRRLSVPGGRDGLHVVPGADRGGQGARQAREVRRALQPGDAVLEQSDRRREGAHRARVPLRADQGADGRGPQAHGRGLAQRRGRARGGRRGGARASSCPTRCRKCSTARRGRKWRIVRRAVAVRAAAATATSRRAGSRSWWPTASTASRSCACTRRSRSAAPCRVSSGRPSGESTAAAIRSRSRSRSTRRRGRRGRLARRQGGREDAGQIGHAMEFSRIIPALQADPRSGSAARGGGGLDGAARREGSGCAALRGRQCHESSSGIRRHSKSTAH